ncbi:MAG: triose-phosphate isomerase [Candidatus Pacebacteria bacterium]|nr:triose-phosphate isomerase [Candidatus Paceibacterota bacterium]
MARRICIAGNWKMNKTREEAVALVSELKEKVGHIQATDTDVVVCPPFTALWGVSEALAGTAIGVGAQNIHWEESGAFTGEISADMLTEIPVQYAIIGHSERRQYFNESDDTVNKRLNAALKAGLTPIVCVGETLEQRESGDTETVVDRQLSGGLAGISAKQMESVILAYEPVWAIGTGRTATPQQAQEVHAFIRRKVADSVGDVSQRVRILYGGSVKPGNASELLAQPDLDGALVGGASLKADDFLGIIEAATA